ncbi:MAG: Lrp/AsnC family transcriptional regulator [Lachnospiraceae bacterium]|nr:Lrp/AsnC family transcriptional regulator [Lachnospiraceae bacterium]
MREKILELLERDSRVSTAEAAILLGEPEEAVQKEIRAMEEEGVICGYHALINWEKVAEEKVIALIEVRVTPQRDMGFDNIAERIYQYEEVKSVYLMSGAYDFTVIVEGKTMKNVAQFVSSKLATIDGVLSTATHFIMKQYKEDGTVMAPREKDERIPVTL